MEKTKKTNAMRILDIAKTMYQTYEYDTADGLIDGISVAKKLGRNQEEVFKTLVTVGTSKAYYVFVVPVEAELNLKKAAAAAKEKKIDMIAVKDILNITGYVKGGCSPIGMKKRYKTFVDESAQSLSWMIVSAGKIGQQIELSPENLLQMTEGSFFVNHT